MGAITWLQGIQPPQVGTGNCSTLYIVPEYTVEMLHNQDYRKSLEERLENEVYKVLAHASKEDVVESLKGLVSYHSKFFLIIQNKRIEEVVLKHNIPHIYRKGLLIINGREL